MRQTVLIVEDHDVIRESMRELLESEGYYVATASNGREALDQLNAIAIPCLILLDLMMPIMSGGEFLAALAQSRTDVLQQSAVVVITAAADTFGRHLPVPALEVLSKPVDIDLLVSLAERHCGKVQCC